MALTIRNTDEIRPALDQFKRRNMVATDSKAIMMMVKMYETSNLIRSELIERLERSQALNAEYKRRFEELEHTLRRSLECAVQEEMEFLIAKEDYNKDQGKPFCNHS